MKKPKVCECCGHPLPEGDEIEQALTGLQRRMYVIVSKAGSAGLSRNAIHERLYGHRSDGGPDIRNIISTMTRQTNLRLEKFGIEMRGTPGRDDGTYRIQPINWKRRIVQAKQMTKRERKADAPHR